MIDIQTIAHLADFLGRMPTQEQRITRHMQKTMLQVVASTLLVNVKKSSIFAISVLQVNSHANVPQMPNSVKW